MKGSARTVLPWSGWQSNASSGAVGRLSTRCHVFVQFLLAGAGLEGDIVLALDGRELCAVHGRLRSLPFSPVEMTV